LRTAILVAGALATLPGWIGCRSGPGPEALFAEAEQLRGQHRKAASEQAIAKYRLAMAAWSRRGDRGGAARAAQRVGATFGHLGLLHESQRGYLEALPLAQASADRLLESEILSDLGMVQALIADRDALYEQARERCEAALELSRRSGLREAQALTAWRRAYYRQLPTQPRTYGRAQGGKASATSRPRRNAPPAGGHLICSS
jgi:tetratricopeptide (TPR) repeat protein